MDKQFRRILDLVRRTGDRMIVTDPDGENVYVVMDIDAYEGLIDMEDHVFDSVMGEEDDGPWEEEEDLPEELFAPEQPEDAAPAHRIWDHIPPAGAEAETWDMNKLSGEEVADLEQKFAEYSNKIKEVALQPPAKPVEPVENTGIEVKSAEKSLSDEEDFGEEQFYLEPIE